MHYASTAVRMQSAILCCDCTIQAEADEQQHVWSGQQEGHLQGVGRGGEGGGLAKGLQWTQWEDPGASRLLVHQ